MEASIQSKGIFMTGLLMAALFGLCLLIWAAAYTGGMLLYALLVGVLVMLLARLIGGGRTL